VFIPSSFGEQDLATLSAYIDAHPLATLVTSAPTDGLIATHLPLVLDRASGPRGTLIGHLARANPQSRAIADESLHALVIFTGPDAYVTPTWYATKAESGRVVPTWNYVAVHAYGTLRLNDDPPFLRGHLEALTKKHESSRSEPWQVSDAPEEFIAQQMKAIIGVSLEIDRLEGKWKMSQNRSDADIAAVIHGLSASSVPQDQEVARIVAERRPKR
jgi:transcriptional regulator